MSNTAHSKSSVTLWGILALVCVGASVATCATPSPRPGTSPSALPAPGGSPTASLAAGDFRVEDFEQAAGLTGGLWLEVDKSGLGTLANPLPWKPEPGGAPTTPGAAGRVFGTLGSNTQPWSWVQLQIHLNRDKSPRDLRGYRSVRFFVKGDGGRYGLSLVKQNVSDFDHFRYEFSAPKEWTEIQVPLTDVKQAGWGKRVPQVFDDVLQIHFFPVRYDQPFDFRVDDVVLSPSEVHLKPVPYATAGWFPWTGIDPKKRRGTALDVSRLLDAPAGKHGPLGKRGERFVFRDGKEARFWGVNIVASANFPSHEEADQLAEMLAQLGVNMTRHHHLDAAWSHPNLFGNGPTTLELNPQALERFDYFVSQLQKRGIYQFLDLLVNRKATVSDGVPEADRLTNGFKIEGEFDPKLIDLQEKFTTQLMGHVNPYTKRAYAKDPAVALLEVINEDSLFYLREAGEFAVKTPTYRATLNRLFSEWLEKKVTGGADALEKRWDASAGAEGLRAGEDPKQRNVDAVLPFEKDGEKRLSRARTRDTLEFLYDTQLAYYRRLEARLRALGYLGLVAGSNHWTEHPLDLLANAQMGFVDRHAYWSHPNGGWGYAPSVTWDPGAMVKDPNLGIVGSLAARRVKGLPYSTSEWQTSAPNDFRVEGVVLMGAYACFQGMSPLEFSFSHEAGKKPDVPTRLSSNFDVIEQPAMLGAWPAISLLYHRRDVRESDLEAYVAVDRESAYTPSAHLPSVAGLGLVARTGVDFRGKNTARELALLRQHHLKGSVSTSNTGELRHDASAGRFEMDTRKSQGFVGFRPSSKVLLSNLEIELESPFAAVLATSLDDVPIAGSKRVLVSALGNAVNTNMSLTQAGNRLADPGSSPTLVEPILGKITLNKLTGPLEKAKVYALAASGDRKSEVPLERSPGALSFRMTAAAGTLHYEIARE